MIDSSIIEQAHDIINEPEITAFLAALETMRGRLSRLSPRDVARLKATGADLPRLARVIEALSAVADLLALSGSGSSRKDARDLRKIKTVLARLAE